MMVIGTYRKLPLIGRIRPDFPEPHPGQIELSGTCALTGLQLLGLVLQVRSAPESKEAIRDRLFKTHGVFPDAADWRSFLEVVTT
jgi:hypothetical protein